MRVVLHDYSGHPFQAQLARELARRGHITSHVHCATFATGHGALARRSDDPAGLDFAQLSTGSAFARYSPGRRVMQELQYGRALGRYLQAAAPDVAILCNTPLLAHSVAARMCARAGIPMLFWHQDIYSHAIDVAARQRLGVIGAMIGRVATRIERRIARRSAQIVAISPSFEPVLREWGVIDRTTVIPNWAPLDELPMRDRNNEWARAQGLTDGPVLVYAGTLGLKHDPMLLADIARALKGELPNANVVVVSEGRGRELLEGVQREEQLPNLRLLDFQPYELLPDVLASADLLLTVLEPEASAYSVPSKVLTYLCAGRPLLGLMDVNNAAAINIVNSGAGVVVGNNERERAVEAATEILGDPGAQAKYGQAARAYAERTFDVRAVADRFEEVLEKAKRSS